MVFSLVFSEVLVSGEHEHDCIGADCPICLQISAVRDFLKLLKMAYISLGLAVFAVLIAPVFSKSAKFKAYYISPIMLKVRINA
jgi:hypothetical protein